MCEKLNMDDIEEKKNKAIARALKDQDRKKERQQKERNEQRQRDQKKIDLSLNRYNDKYDTKNKYYDMNK